MTRRERQIRQLIEQSPVVSQQELAAAFKTRNDLGFPGGMLVTNPIPEEYAMPLQTINAAIDQAIAESKEKSSAGFALYGKFLFIELFTDAQNPIVIPSQSADWRGNLKPSCVFLQ